MGIIKQTQNIRQGLSTRESRLLARLAGAGHQIISVDDTRLGGIAQQEELLSSVVNAQLNEFHGA